MQEKHRKEKRRIKGYREEKGRIEGYTLERKKKDRRA
jgi:hypothetical protein